MLGLAATAPVRAAPLPDDPSSRADEFARRVLATQKAPGFAVAVVRDGSIVYAKGFGVADVAAGSAVTADTPFSIGSLTKQLTAAAVLLLVEDGKLRLDDTLASFEPSIPNAPALTLRELLNQTSGLHNYANPMEHAWPMQGTIAIRRIIEILATDKPDFAPGTRWEYSNANYTVLASVVEHVSGGPIAAFMSARIFRPLRMTKSGFGYAAGAKLAPAHAYAGVKTFDEQQPVSADLFSGAGGAYASASDMARWDIGLLENRLLNAASRELMFAPGTLKDGTPTAYGMGFIPDKLDGHRMIWHNGLAPGAGGYCFNAVFPDDRMAIVVLSNGYNFDGEPERLVHRLFASFAARA